MAVNLFSGETYTCDFCEDKTDKIIDFASPYGLGGYSELNLCFSCFDQNIGRKILTSGFLKKIDGNSYQNLDCMFCGVLCCGGEGTTKDCAIEVSHRWVQYRICKSCWKKERDL